MWRASRWRIKSRGETGSGSGGFMIGAGIILAIMVAIVIAVALFDHIFFWA